MTDDKREYLIGMLGDALQEIESATDVAGELATASGLDSLGFAETAYKAEEALNALTQAVQDVLYEIDC